MQKIIDYFKQYIGVISIVLALCILLTYSLSYFKVNIDNKRAAEMYIGELKYSMTIEGSSTNTLSVPAGETIVDIDLTNQNEIKTYFKLLYLKNSNVTISYYNESKDTSNNITKYLAAGDLIEKSTTSTLKLKIINNSTSTQTLTFSVSGGYSTNKLTDIEVPSTYSEITTLETTASNTYFCKTGDTLNQGLKYVDEQYTYSYRQQGSSNSSTTLSWDNIATKGWGVQLTNKASTDTVNSKLCTYINNKPTVSMTYMFYKSKAASIDVSGFDTSYVTDMNNMFASSQTTTISGLNVFNTSNVINMQGMFSTSKAASLDLSNFDTSNVTNMGNMFMSSAIKEINGLNKFNTGNVINMFRMFSSSQVTSIDLSSFNTSNVTNMGYMFANTQATKIDVSGFNTSNVTNMSYMFSGCKAEIDVSKFDTKNVIYMSYMFSGSKTTTIDVSKFNTSNVTNMSYMFANTQAKNIDLSNFNTSKVTDMSDMFRNSQALTIDLSNFNTSKVTNMDSMFRGSAATIINVSSFDTSNVLAMSSMFDSSQVKSLDLSNFDTSKVTSIGSIFRRSQLATLDLSSFDTSNVVDMPYMFYNSENLKTIYVSNKFNTDKVDVGMEMFYGCTNLVGGNGTKYNRSNVDKTYARIDTSSTPGYFTLKNN